VVGGLSADVQGVCGVYIAALAAKDIIAGVRWHLLNQNELVYTCPVCRYCQQKPFPRQSQREAVLICSDQPQFLGLYCMIQNLPRWFCGRHRISTTVKRKSAQVLVPFSQWSGSVFLTTQVRFHLYRCFPDSELCYWSRRRSNSAVSRTTQHPAKTPTKVWLLRGSCCFFVYW